MTFELRPPVLLLCAFGGALLSCVDSAPGTSVDIRLHTLAQDRGIQTGVPVVLDRGSLAMWPPMLEACPDTALAAVLRALTPISAAYAHGAEARPDGASVVIDVTQDHDAPVMAVSPRAGRYCSVIVIFGPDQALGHTFSLQGHFDDPQAPSTVEGVAWIRSELALAAPIELDADRLSARVDLELSLDTWFSKWAAGQNDMARVLAADLSQAVTLRDAGSAR